MEDLYGWRALGAVNVHAGHATPTAPSKTDHKQAEPIRVEENSIRANEIRRATNKSKKQKKRSIALQSRLQRLKQSLVPPGLHPSPWVVPSRCWAPQLRKNPSAQNATKSSKGVVLLNQKMGSVQNSRVCSVTLIYLNGFGRSFCMSLP